jgi:hypothetical protein
MFDNEGNRQLFMAHLDHSKCNESINISIRISARECGAQHECSLDEAGSGCRDFEQNNLGKITEYGVLGRIICNT